MGGNENKLLTAEIIKDVIVTNLPKEWRICFKAQGGYWWEDLTKVHQILNILEENINVGGSNDNRCWDNKPQNQNNN